MKATVFAISALTTIAYASLSPAIAQGPKPSSGNNWPGISQRVGTNSVTAEAASPHYIYQYGYDRHAAWRGHWVLVR